ncbi:MAG: ComF family protein [Chromatiales bacterium]|nr:ComF family protein [Chromatiales bacterium]
MEINNWLTNIQDWLLPRLCPGCGDWAGAGRELCPGCERSLPVISAACPRCAAPYAHAGLAAAGECGQCQRQPPPFDRARAVFHYAPPVDHFIRALKFHGELGLGRWLGEQLAQCVAADDRQPDLIVPVPLHRARLRARGYNQALELARPVARALKVPIDARALQRVRATDAQSDLPFDARRRNVRGAFAVADDTAVRDRRVVLIDDVMTTGNTVGAAAAALRAAGAAEIECG